MKGRDRFRSAEAAEIRRLLGLVRRAEPGTPQKLLRDKLRAIGFYISDFGGSGFTPSDFDDLVHRGRVLITDGAGPDAAAVAPTARSSAPAAKPRRQRRASPRAFDLAGGRADVQALVDAVLAALSAEPMTIKAAMSGGVTDDPGLYALYGAPAVWKRLGLGAPPDGRPLYVGKAEDSLVSRDLNTHFATGETGRSSPRRSFAALLAREGALELVAMPRRAHDPEPRKWDCYALEAAGDDELTKWMHSRLRIAVWPRIGDVKLATIEGQVMRRWRPPLNLIGVDTPWRRDVKDARAELVRASKQWARDHGFTG
jgi:hypothetical protein